MILGNSRASYRGRKKVTFLPGPPTLDHGVHILPIFQISYGPRCPYLTHIPVSPTFYGPYGPSIGTRIYMHRTVYIQLNIPENVDCMVSLFLSIFIQCIYRPTFHISFQTYVESNWFLSETPNLKPTQYPMMSTKVPNPDAVFPKSFLCIPHFYPRRGGGGVLVFCLVFV